MIDCNNLSKSSSCDSILSIATNGFAFVAPNCYEAALANPAASRRTIQPGPYTDSYKRRCTEQERARELDRKYERALVLDHDVHTLSRMLSYAYRALAHDEDSW